LRGKRSGIGSYGQHSCFLSLLAWNGPVLVPLPLPEANGAERIPTTINAIRYTGSH
jgi:hypothetical protein